MLFTTVKLTRKELYEEIWKISAAGVAKKYGIPYAKCLAQIKAAKIPIPPSGYWTKISYGKPVEQTPLQGNEDEVVALSAGELRRYHTPQAEEPEEPPLSVPPQEETVLSPSDTFSLAAPAARKPSGDDASQPTDIPPETDRRLGQTYNVYDRETLYKEVWAMPVAEVAKRYHVSDAVLHKACKSLDIPTPPQVYWAKLREGKPVQCLPLPPEDKKTKPGIQTTISYGGNNKGNPTLLAFLTEEERQAVLNAAAQILMPQEHDRMLPEILTHRKRIAEWAKRKRQQEREFGANWNRGRKEIPPPFAEGISAEQRPRVFRLIDALSKTMKPLGWKLTSDLQFAMGQEVVTLTFSEAADRVPHTPTKKENLELLKYEEERKDRSWAGKPQIRKYDTVYNGRLSVSINGTRIFRDCRSYVLEDRLGDMMLAIYEEAERLKQVRLAREEAERQRQEQERKREEFRKRYNTEVDRTQALVNCAGDYETACRIRSYVSAVERAQPDQDLSEWASWARSKADWYDPTIAKEDELFGKREHGISQEKKEPKRKEYW